MNNNNNNNNDIYSRQQSLNLNIPASATIIGVGGVGSWVAFNFALTGIPHLILVDPDTIEPHNLNRTPFRLQDINTPKVTALMQLILERRECTITPYQKRVEELPPSLLDADIIIDCRDTSTPIHPALQKKVRIIGGYDGFNITLHLNPDPSSIWGDGPTRYTITPSWLVPPQFIANIITQVAVQPPIAKQSEEKTCSEEKIININLKQFTQNLFTIH